MLEAANTSETSANFCLQAEHLGKQKSLENNLFCALCTGHANKLTESLTHSSAYALLLADGSTNPVLHLSSFLHKHVDNSLHNRLVCYGNCAVSTPKKSWLGTQRPAYIGYLLLLFWAMTSCTLVGRYKFSEKHIVSIFTAEDGGSIFFRNVAD
jgi:hypothetical protein